MNETTKDLIRNILVFVFLILTIAVIYAYDVFKDSKKTGLSPFSYKVLVCEFSNKELWSEYNEQDMSFKKAYPDFDFPKFIALKLNANAKGKFVSMKWGEKWIRADKVFVNPYFNFPQSKKFRIIYLSNFRADGSKLNKGSFGFSKIILSERNFNFDGTLKDDAYPVENINFEIINDELLLIDYFRVSYSEYKCVKTDKPIME
jgi:hypothetical protein